MFDKLRNRRTAEIERRREGPLHSGRSREALVYDATTGEVYYLLTRRKTPRQVWAG